jgi:hypothetical protein
LTIFVFLFFIHRPALLVRSVLLDPRNLKLVMLVSTAHKALPLLSFAPEALAVQAAPNFPCLVLRDVTALRVPKTNLKSALLATFAQVS